MNSDARIVKPAHSKVQYNQAEVQELAKCAHPVTGPKYFITNYVYVQNVTRGKVKFDLYPFQVELIDNYHNYRYSVSLISRQMGKSTVAAAYLLWYAMFNDDVTILVASNKHEGAMEIMHRLRYAYENLPDFIRAGSLSYNKKSIEFDNGSRIISQATTENTGRGLTLNLVYLDEFAFVTPRVAKEFWTSISPTLSTGGKCIITSTPSSNEDQFADIWFQANKRIDEYGNPKEVGTNGFRPYFATWEEHPDRDEEWAANELAKIGEDRFAREHKCSFVIFEETLINQARISSMESKPPIYVENQVRWYKDIVPDATYIMALDPAMGTGGDFSAIQVFELPSLVQVAEWQHNKSPVEVQLKVLRDIGKKIEAAGVSELYWSVENNTLGEASLVVIRELGEDMFPGQMLHDPGKGGQGKLRKGFTTTNRNKLEACAKLKSWIEMDKMVVYSRNLISELKTFVSSGAGFEAKTGSTDDLVMALILAVRIICLVASWDDSMQNRLTTRFDDEHNPIDDDDYDPPMPVAFL